ncbi:MAG: hypothetical protein GY745_03150 [Actinomycetia bacterium]|nr:hypothetical protein [Actinomycetes bacterium]MCP4084045.1 hypothetical protein [Actinomycetes bacterium]
MLGPVQLLAFEFDTLEQFHGEILDRLEEVAPLNAVRILDALFVAKEANGELVALEWGDLGEEEGDEVLGFIIGELLGFSFEGEEPGAPPADITEASAIGVTVTDIRRIARDLRPGTAAGLLLVEHRWAAGLRDAIFEAGGSLMLQGFLTLEGLAMVGAELTAAAEAIAAIELADALEAEATVRSIEALATIELAAEVEAAVVARTVLGLVEAGFIEMADAQDAAAALLGNGMIDSVSTDEGNS